MALGNNASAPVSSCEWLDGVPDPRIRAVVQRPGDVRSRRGRSGDGSRRRRGYDVDIPWRRRERGRRPASPQVLFFGQGVPHATCALEESWGRGCRADIPRRRVAATPRGAARIFRGDKSRRRCGYELESPRDGRGDAAGRELEIPRACHRRWVTARLLPDGVREPHARPVEAVRPAGRAL